MRFGCGCLLGVGLTLLGGGTVWGVLRALQVPNLQIQQGTAGDGRRAQEKIYEVMMRRAGGRAGPRQTGVALSEPEINALLSRHLEGVVSAALSTVAVRLPSPGILEFTGRVPLGHLLSGTPLWVLGKAAPPAFARRPVWIHAEAAPWMEPGNGQRRYLRLDVKRLWVGRLRVPALAANVLFNRSRLGLLRWRLPEGVENLTIEPGQVVIRTAA